MTWQLSAPVALPEDQALFPNIHTGSSQPPVTPELILFSGLLGDVYTCGAHTDKSVQVHTARAHTHTHK